MGSITTDIIKNGLVFNMDAANRASYVPDATTSFNTINLSESGSFVNDPTFISPPTSASCWDFDGSDDYINCGTDSSLKPTSAYSVSGWFKLDGLVATQKTIISNDNNSGYMTWVANDKLWFYHFDTGWRTITSNTTLVADTWYHFALTWDLSSTTGKMYINGVYDNQNTSFNQVTYLSTPVYIGTYGPSVYYEGNIANVQIYSRTLSSTEVLHNYNALKSRFE